MFLSHALRIRPKELVAFVGAGGKTTAMLRLADELVAQGWRVIVTTTTRMFAAQVGLTPYPLHPIPPLLDLKFSPGEGGRGGEATILVGKDIEGDKVAGVPPAVLDELAASNQADVILVEADGARMLPFKAPAAHEPVVPGTTTLLVPVVGVSVVGAPLDAQHVHRPEMVARLAGAKVGDAITPTMIARVIAHSEGGLKSKPAGACVVVLVNQVESERQLDAAREIARLLLKHDEIEGVAIGAVQDASSPIREMRRRVAAIVLAAGAGTRMGERVKQLLPWRGKTLIENAVEIATRADVDEIVVVLGARAEIIRPVIESLPVRIAQNPDWAEGHSTSIRVGLGALNPQTDAAIFINGDQPLITPEIVNAILQRHRETGVSIVAPRYAGQRGSPVLFGRAHFAELMRLSGEQGGREVLVKYPVEYVEFAEARAAFDVDTPEDYARSAQIDTA
ncbi:MAG: putative selenium-dependent hydroxylase accessory protein YqeC [Chloroflexi bacterium]|nr:putative selenium-dependent hydroxylase accessory protein YqeC [Chloroflexota bacterium]